MSYNYIKIDEDTYVLWSSITDSPVAWGSKEALTEWQMNSIVEDQRAQLNQMFDRADTIGWSSKLGNPYPLNFTNAGTLKGPAELKGFIESYKRIDGENESYDDSFLDEIPPET